MEKLFVEVDEKTGEAFFDGIPCEISNRYYHADLQRGFEKIIGPPTRTIMYNSAFMAGTLLAQEISKKMKGKTKQEIIKKVMWIISAKGFGAPEVIYIDDKENTITLSVRNSYNVIGYEKTSFPVCHTLAGVIAGIFSVIFDQECECFEKECSAMGAESCMFEIKKTGKKIKFVKPIKVKSKRKGLIKKEVKHDPSKGEVFFQGISSIILVLGWTGIYQKKFEDTIGPTSRSIIYDECKKTTLKAIGTLTKTLVKIFGKLTVGMSLKKLVDQIPERGWGVGKVISVDKDKPALTIQIKNCFNHKYYGKTDKPACYSFAAIAAAGGEIIFNRPMVCKEVMCESLGDPYCEFIATPDKK